MPKLEFISKELVDKGRSKDKKYCVKTHDSTKYFLRVNTIGKEDKLKKLYEISQEVETLGITFCNAAEYGVNEEGEYILQRWVEGEDAEKVIPTLSEKEQYKYGLEAGQILNKIHSILPKIELDDWAIKFNVKLDQTRLESGFDFLKVGSQN